MVFRYSAWDGTQSINPLDPDALLELLATDLLEEGDLASALQRFLMRGASRSGGPRGIRDFLEQLRQRREQQTGQYDLGSFMDEVRERLDEIVQQERLGIDQLRSPDRPDAPTEAEMREMVERLAQRKEETLDSLPDDVAGKLQRLMDYEFLDADARQSFQDLVNELRQQMLGDQFQSLQQGMESLTKEDLGPIKEMMRALNELLAKHVRGGATEEDFREFMARFGHMFPPGIETLEDLVAHLERQAEQMASLLKSMPEDMRRQLEETMRALLQDDDLQMELMQMTDFLEQITGHPLGRPYSFSGDTQVGLDEAMDLMRSLNEVDQLERQLRQAIREMNFDLIDKDLAKELLGPEAAAELEELKRLTTLLQESGLAKQGRRDLELTAKGIRRIGEAALRDLFAELRRDRVGQHDARARGVGSEQVTETKPLEFGDPFLVDIGTTLSNAVRRSGPGVPVKLEASDLEVHRTESLITSSTVIAVDMSRSMFNNGAFIEAKRVALALNTLIKTRFPRDYLGLVVFSYFAMELNPDRLLQSDWVDWSGTNIEVALEKARQMLSKQTSTNRQIILITDWRPRPTWGSRGEEGTIEDMLREVKRCTRSGIRINTFMMDHDPSSMALAQAMMRINKGRVFFGAPGGVGRYVLVDYMRNRRKRI
jgi:uncharacterized protein with von Willebrand factor type A (vWA) domain